MYLQKIQLNNFRCYSDLVLNFNQPVNLIKGLNGSGKTALLEAIYWQSTGRSFRHHKPVDLIQHNMNEMSVYSEYLSDEVRLKNKLGVGYQRNKQKTIKLNGQTVRKQTDIAQHFPVIAIDPDAYLWVDQPPQFRRSFLDWLVFHVKPEYLTIWKKTIRVQKQINELLKNQKINQLDLWEERYADLAMQTQAFRKEVFNQLTPLILAKLNQFLPEVKEFTIDLKKGWHSDDLLEQLKKDRNRNLRLGSLVSGIHKADIHCFNQQKPVNIIFSQGQKKSLSLLFYLSFIDLYQIQKGYKPIVCIDDIDSELDQNKIQLLSEIIKKSEWQVFISSVSVDRLKHGFENKSVFHVKQSNNESKVVLCD